jgi:hypothetical protein
MGVVVVEWELVNVVTKACFRLNLNAAVKKAFAVACLAAKQPLDETVDKRVNPPIKSGKDTTMSYGCQATTSLCAAPASFLITL